MVEILDFAHRPVYDLIYPDFNAQAYDIDDNISWFSHEEREDCFNSGVTILNKLASSIPIAGKYDPDEQFEVGLTGLAKAIETYNPNYQTTFTTWATRLVKNAMIENARHLALKWGGFETFDKSNSDEDNEGVVTWEGILSGVEPEIGYTYALQEIIEDIKICINDLSERRRMVLLRSVDGLNPYNALHKAERQEDIAADFGVSQALISKILIRARSDLKIMLACRFHLSLNDFLPIRESDKSSWVCETPETMMDEE